MNTTKPNFNINAIYKAKFQNLALPLKLTLSSPAFKTNPKVSPIVFSGTVTILGIIYDNVTASIMEHIWLNIVPKT